MRGRSYTQTKTQNVGEEGEVAEENRFHLIANTFLLVFIDGRVCVGVCTVVSMCVGVCVYNGRRNLLFIFWHN